MPGVGNQGHPYRCSHSEGRLGGCVCMCDVGATTPPPTPPPATCYSNALHYDAESRVGGLLRAVASATQCQAHCVANPLCAFWSYQIAGSACYLYNHGASAVTQQQGFMSGPKVCSRSATTHPYDDPQFLDKARAFTNYGLRTAVALWFSDRAAALAQYGPMALWNTRLVTDMSTLFKSRTDFNEPIGAWDTSKVTNMKAMFSGAETFNKPIGAWDTSKVTDMSNMFNGVSSCSVTASGPRCAADASAQAGLR